MGYRCPGVALLAAALAADFYQYSASQAARQARLESAIVRPTVTSNGQTLDADLKETAYEEQLVSPRGISTDELQRLLGEQQNGLRGSEILVDVREPAETKMGSFPGARSIRFPDFPKAHLDLTGKTAVLFCDNGNRSYETCQKLAAMGIDCRFLVGGLEKWLAEHKPFGKLKSTSVADFRALPTYVNKDVLLDTPDVKKLLQQGAVFVDVRYPGEFSAYHLPGAINLPIRSTPAEELRARLSALPHHPIIAPCYDRRSCFYAQILGYEATQAGYDFRGRYTVPWDYFTQSAPRPYIREYLTTLHQNWWQKLVGVTAAALNKLIDHVPFVLTIIFLALISRLLVLPFSMKAERDQITSRARARDLQELKKRLASDPARLARATRAFYRQHGLTPIRNLIGLAFLPLMSVCVAAIQAVAVTRHLSILWIVDLARADLTFILPLLFSFLICAYVDSAFVSTLRQRLPVWIIGMTILSVTGSLLSAAADCYLVISAVLLLAQRALVTGKFSAAFRWVRRRKVGELIVSLDEVERLQRCGNKAYRLAEMRSKGLPVPEGVVLPTIFLRRFLSEFTEWRSRQLDRVWRTLRSHRVAVRSSGSDEDSSLNSFAGVFETVLNVDRAGLEAAMIDVLVSFNNEVALAYGAGNGQANIIVQRMIEPLFSGVLFTRDPASPSHALVELVEGTADKLVSGAVVPILCRFGRVSMRPI